MDSKKIDERFVKEAIDEYNRRNQNIREQITTTYPTVEKNGGVYKVVNMSLEDFKRTNNAVDMEDIKWT